MAIAAALARGCAGKAPAAAREPAPPVVEQPAETAWVHIDPIQCLGNPWQMDWMVPVADVPVMKELGFATEQPG